MLLKCEYTFINRLSPALQSKKCHATFMLGKRNNCNGKEEIYFTINTVKNTGQKFLIKGNILRVHSKYSSEGKCTISIKEPPYDFAISKAPVDVLKKFLLVLKLAFKGEDTSTVVNLNNMLLPKNADIKKPKKSLTVLSKEQYPIKTSFPETLETLIVNNCILKKFDVRVLKLKFLITLDLSFNKLTTLCDNFDELVNLKSLLLQSNSFKTIPKCVVNGNVSKQIQLLDLSNNDIEFLPNKISVMKDLVTLKLTGNKIQYLPSNFGMLSKLQYLHLNQNKLKVLPWSFQHLRFNILDMSDNLFSDEIELSQPNDKVLDDIPSLFELTARYISHKKLSFESLPQRLQAPFQNMKYCPCGNSCFTNCVPYTKPFSFSSVSHTVRYDNISCQPRIVAYLCSNQCYSKWLDNPNTLFTKSRRCLR